MGTLKFRLALLLTFSVMLNLTAAAKEIFPDGTPIPEWFRQNKLTDINNLGKQYRITDFNMENDSTVIQTALIQSVIDKADENGGGVVVIPKASFRSASFFFKKYTHLHLE